VPELPPGAGKAPRGYKFIRGTAPASRLLTQVGRAAFLGHTPRQTLQPLRHCGLSGVDGHTDLPHGRVPSRPTPRRCRTRAPSLPNPPRPGMRPGAPEEAEECSGAKPQRGSQGCWAGGMLCTANSDRCIRNDAERMKGPFSIRARVSAGSTVAACGCLPP